MIQDEDEGSESFARSDDSWTYRSYRLTQSEFITAMIHFYRGEINRSNLWRTRLDNTTNWAVVTTAAVLTFAFSSETNSHAVILISFLLISLFLVIEGRRYRYYELWTLRVRLMETDFFAKMLRPPFAPHSEWAPRLVDSLLTPQFPISFWEALGRRLRRNYIWIFLVLGLAWTLKLFLFPSQIHSLESFLDHASLGPIPGVFILSTVIGFYVAILLIAFSTAGLTASPGEVLTRDQVLGIPKELLRGLARKAGDMPFSLRAEQLVIIITAKPTEVSQELLSVLGRGVTGLEGRGMYSGQSRSVLFCAVKPREVERVKSVVYATDERAFVVVNPTQDIFGGDFRELRPSWKRPASDEG